MPAMVFGGLCSVRGCRNPCDPNGDDSTLCEDHSRGNRLDRLIGKAKSPKRVISSHAPSMLQRSVDTALAGSSASSMSPKPVDRDAASPVAVKDRVQTKTPPPNANAHRRQLSSDRGQGDISEPSAFSPVDKSAREVADVPPHGDRRTVDGARASGRSAAAAVSKHQRVGSAANIAATGSANKPNINARASNNREESKVCVQSLRPLGQCPVSA